MKHLFILVFVLFSFNVFACLERGKLEVVDKGEYHQMFLSEQPKKVCHWYGNTLSIKIQVFITCEGFTEVVEMNPHDTLYYQINGDITVASRCVFQTTHTTLSIDNYNVCIVGDDGNYCVEEYIIPQDTVTLDTIVVVPPITNIINDVFIDGGKLYLQGIGVAKIIDWNTLSPLPDVVFNNEFKTVDLNLTGSTSFRVMIYFDNRAEDLGVITLY